MDIVSRLKSYIAHCGMTSTQFADTAGIPRPTLSQILSGRNKKISNELLAKLHTACPDLNILWLLFGTGSMLDISGTDVAPEVTSKPTDTYDNNDGLFALDNGVSPTDNVQTGTKDAVRGLNSSLNNDYSPENSVINTNFGARNSHISDTSNRKFDHRNTNSVPAEPNMSPIDRTSAQQPPITDTASQLSTPYTSTQKGTTTTNQPTSMSQTIESHLDPSKRIASIMVFYSDNSYEIFKPAND